MLASLLCVQENELVLVRNTLLPTATFGKLQPHTTDFLDVSHHKELSVPGDEKLWIFVFLQALWVNIQLTFDF